MQSKPTSTRQSASHPSPPAVLLSSQNSAVERMPLPQMCTGGTYDTGSTPAEPVLLLTA